MHKTRARGASGAVAEAHAAFVGGRVAKGRFKKRGGTP